MSSAVGLDLDVMIGGTLDNAGYLLSGLRIGDRSGDHGKLQVVSMNAGVEEKVALKAELTGVVSHGSKQAVAED